MKTQIAKKLMTLEQAASATAAPTPENEMLQSNKGIRGNGNQPTIPAFVCVCVVI